MSKFKKGVVQSMKKAKYVSLATLILALSLLFIISISSPTAQAQRMDFVDTEGHWVMEYLEALNSRDVEIFQGFEENGRHYLRPTRHITRAEFAAIFVRTFDLHDPAAVNPFADVPNNAWYASYVASATQNGVVRGVNAEGTRFAPNAPLTRQEAMVMIARFYQSLPYFNALTPSEQQLVLTQFVDIPSVADWARESVAFVTYHEIVVGITDGPDRWQRPQNRLRRAEVVAMMERALDRIQFAQSSPSIFPWPEHLPRYVPGSVRLWDGIEGDIGMPFTAQHRYVYYKVPGAILDLVDDWEAINEWGSAQSTDVYPSEMLLMRFVQYFNISKEDFVAAIDAMRDSFITAGFDVYDELFEIPNADIIFTFDNDIISHFYRRR